MTEKQRTTMTRLMISGVFLIARVLMEGKVSWAWAPLVISYLTAGHDIPLEALRNIKNGQVFDENFLMTIATFGAITIGSLEEAVVVMPFYQVGELSSDCTVNKSRKPITDLMDINPEYANLLKNGKEEQADPDDVEIDGIIVIKPGEKVSFDGIITRGASSPDIEALTGESMPVEVKEGMDIVSGSINLNGVLEVQVTKLFGDSTVAKTLELVENASEKKAKTENFITKFIRVYTPVAVRLALLFVIVPPLLTGQPWFIWVYRTCSFLAVSCPCALVISVPLGFFGGLGAASKQGILTKGSNYLEAVANLDTVVSDKAGTLTTDKFQVAEVMPAGGSHNDGRQGQGASDHGMKEELLKLAVYSELHSDHPIALSVKEAYGKEVDQNLAESVEETVDHGIHAVLKLKDGPADIYTGNEKLMAQQNVTIPKQDVKMGIILHLVKDGSFMGATIISDTIREDVPAALQGLWKEGVRNLVMLTGDKEEAGRTMAGKLGFDKSFGELLPGGKAHKVEELLAAKPREKILGFVGDGTNDAPVLTRADVGIAMGGIGSDMTVEVADVVIMTDEPSKIVDGIQIARKTMGIAKQNIIFVIGAKILVLILVVAGQASMWAVVSADVGTSVLVILNAIRVLNYRKQCFAFLRKYERDR